MDQRRTDLLEGANYSFTRQHRSSLKFAWEGHRLSNPNPNPALYSHSKSVMGSQVAHHHKCNDQVVGSERLRDLPAAYSISNPEAQKGGITMNEWWTGETSDLTRKGLLRSINGGEHRFGDDKLESTSRQGRHNSDNSPEYLFAAGREERQQFRTSPATSGGIQDSALSCKTMKEWWSSLSASLGNKRSTLHTEILQFCKANDLTPQQNHARRRAQAFLEFTVLQIWPNAEVHLYGSTAMGLALPTSDIDIVVVMHPATEKGLYYGSPFMDTGPFVSELHSKLVNMDRAIFHSLTPIPHAKVPILKVVFITGLACDISFEWQENRPGLAVQLVSQYLKRYKDLKPLILVLKSFLRKQNLNEVFSGGIGSFCLTIMVVNLLQNVGSEAGAASEDLGALLVSFFMYYSCMHNYGTDVVSTRKKVSKQVRGWVNSDDPERLAVENPLDPSSDIGSASFNIHDVRVKFSQARRVLLRHWDEQNLLDRILKPSIA